MFCNWKFPDCVHFFGERTRQVWRDNSRRVRTHEKNSGDAVRWLGTIIQRFFCAQSEAGIRLNFWKWFVKSRYPGALSPVLENFRRAFSPGPTDRPWVSEDESLGSTDKDFNPVPGIWNPINEWNRESKFHWQGFWIQFHALSWITLNEVIYWSCIAAIHILGDPGAVSRVERKGATKVFKYGRKSPWVPTLNEPFPKIQTDATSWLGTKKPLYYCAQSANSISWVLFMCSYTTAIISPYLSGSFTKVVRAYSQGKLSLSASLNRNEGTIDDSEKRFGWLFPFATGKFCFWSSEGIVNNVNRRRDR